MRQEDAAFIPNIICDYVTLLKLQTQRIGKRKLRNLQQLLGQNQEVIFRQGAVPVVHRLHQGVGNSRPGPDHRRLVDAQPQRNVIRRFKSYPPDIPGQAIGIFHH